MKAGRFAAVAGIALVMVMATAAWAWRDCMLLAASTVLALRVFLVRMDHGSPWRPLAASLNCLTAGVLAVAAGVALMAGAGAAWLGWWQPAAKHPALALGLLVAGPAWCCVSRDNREGVIEELWLWALVLAGVVVAMQARSSGMMLAPCLLVASIGLAMVWAGWHLSHGTATSLMRGSGR